MSNKKIQHNQINTPANRLINIAIDSIIFIGTLITIASLVILMFITTSTGIAILAGIGAASSLFTYDMYKGLKKT